MKEEKNVKKIFDIISIMTRSRGRSRSKWKDQLKRDMKKMKITS